MSNIANATFDLLHMDTGADAKTVRETLQNYAFGVEKRSKGLYFGTFSCLFYWRARRDSNPRPSDPKSDALVH